jgi:hypothetical protein
VAVPGATAVAQSSWAIAGTAMKVTAARAIIKLRIFIVFPSLSSSARPPHHKVQKPDAAFPIQISFVKKLLLL